VYVRGERGGVVAEKEGRSYAGLEAEVKRWGDENR